MISYGTYKTSAAWKMYAKSQDVEFAIANEVSKQIARYENALKHASEDDDADEIDIMDYIEPEYREIFSNRKSIRALSQAGQLHRAHTSYTKGIYRVRSGLYESKITCAV